MKLSRYQLTVFITLITFTFPTLGQNNLQLTEIEFTTREGKKASVKAEEGYLIVPEDRSNPEGSVIKLHFIRFKSTSEKPGNPVIYLSGGPGGSGSYSAAGDRFNLFMSLRSIGDVIALDQRGTYGSKPYLVCPNKWSYPLNKPLEKEALAEILIQWSKDCNEYFEEKNVSLAAYNTMESVYDIEDLRISLGYDKLNLWGISYGTHLAAAYMKHYNESVDRAVFAGFEGLDHTLKLPSDIDKVVHRLEQYILSNKTARKITPNLKAEVISIFEELERSSKTVEIDRDGKQVEVTIGKLDAQMAFYENMNERDDISALPISINQVLKGNYETLADWAYSYRRNRRGLAMSHLMDCASNATQERKKLVENQLGNSLLGDAINIGFPSICEGWNFLKLPEEYRMPFESSIPILFIGGTLDGRTPIENLNGVTKDFPNSTQLIIKGAGHDDDLFLSDKKIIENMIDFYLKGTILIDTISLPQIKFQKKN